jgi:hypothetical protein
MEKIMSNYLITYIDPIEQYTEKRNRLLGSCEGIGINHIINYDRSHLMSTEFYTKHKSILDQPRGAGYWLWKPFYVWYTLNQVKDNDTVIIIDVDHFVKHKDILQMIDTQMDPRGIFITHLDYHKNRRWVKRDCFVLTGCDEEKYWDGYHVEAGKCAYRKNDFVMKFVGEWLEHACNENIITDIPNICGKPNFPEFQDHRHDQSILALMTLKYNIKTVDSLELWKFLIYD